MGVFPEPMQEAMKPQLITMIENLEPKKTCSEGM